MAIIVEHEKRKYEILEKSLDIFVEEGYEDVTFQKIADRCGITRTTLYIYFKNKREIFLCSIKQLTAGIEKGLRTIIESKDMTDSVKLKEIMVMILHKCEENRKLFNVILTYLLQIQKSGKDAGERVRRRVLRLRHLLSWILIEGINSGEFRPIDVKATNELFYGLIQSAIFRLAVLNQADVNELIAGLDIAIQGIKA
ncbi:MAG: TetR/AcrR family transcriptional regulator [Treponemataceae bacterium]|nr:TetR/AcrR family transcriptional regulator [Treponemataceae bacterium]